MTEQLSPQKIIKIMEACVFELELSPAEKRLFTINYNHSLTVEDECFCTNVNYSSKEYVCSRCNSLTDEPKCKQHSYQDMPICVHCGEHLPELAPPQEE